MVTSHQGIALIKHFESFFDTAYLCAAGVPTIGWGTVAYPDGRDVQLGETCTRDQAEEWLLFELKEKEVAVTRLTEGIILSQPRFDALVSFAYNMGIGSLERSTLLRKLRVNQNDETIWGDENMKVINFGRGGEFLRWCRVEKGYNLGLIRRRKAEAWLYATGGTRYFEDMLALSYDATFYINKAKI
jgi:lysozyme